MKKHPIFYLLIGIAVLIIPTAVYLVFLIPQMTEEYNILMASGGVIGSAGLFGASKIPKEVKYSGLLKLASNSFTIMICMLLVEKFLLKIMGLVAVFIVSFIIFQILKGAYKNGKRRNENKELAEQVARSLAESSK